ncbi:MULTISPECIES: AlbA family DNA-binding domain-containing protein [Halomonadaceae]|uniref:AlbA family DNA-binding domain-containing protein n=1 Tax=Halomonadaceae TaxID=28256 RepID=UPI001330B7F1|nr:MULTISPECIES: ATP-binding protein [Halomonas]
MEIDLIEMMSHGESQSVEFLRSDTSPLVLAKVISAFANADGGTILFGVSDSSTISGVDPEIARDKIEKALGMLSLSDVVTYDIKKIRIVLYVAVIKVTKSDQIIYCDSGAYIRSGEHVRVMHQNEISSLIRSPNGSIETLSGVLEKQTLMIESLELTISSLKSEIAEENSLKSKIRDHSIGGFVGILVGVVLGTIGF